MLMDIKVHAVPALNDNYIWMICNTASQCICVDPGDAAPVLAFLKRLNMRLCAIFITHHHWDHTHGIAELVEHSKAPVYGPLNEPPAYCKYKLSEGDVVNLTGFPEFKILDIPGHTLGHIAYVSDGMAFTGDTLFTAGCGRVFEGSMEQMLESLDHLNALPDETLIYCGHEYTENNLKFAKIVEPDNIEINNRYHEVVTLREQNQATVPASLSIERKTNPFLRIRELSVVRAAQEYSGQPLPDPSEVFAVIRRWKDKL